MTVSVFRAFLRLCTFVLDIFVSETALSVIKVIRVNRVIRVLRVNIE